MAAVRKKRLLKPSIVENSAKDRRFHRVPAMDATERYKSAGYSSLGQGGVLHCQPSLDCM